MYVLIFSTNFSMRLFLDCSYFYSIFQPSCSYKKIVYILHLPSFKKYFRVTTSHFLILLPFWMKFCQKTLPQTLAQNFGKQEKILDFCKWGLKVEYKCFYKSASKSLKLFFGLPYPLNNCRNFFASYPLNNCQNFRVSEQRNIYIQAKNTTLLRA